MKRDNVFAIRKQAPSLDPLSEVLRKGARQLLEQALEAEIQGMMITYEHDRLATGKNRLVRNGYMPERDVLTGIGTIPVRVPRVRDRGNGEESIIFHSRILPPYLRKARDVESVLPWLYLKGVSTGDFQEALLALLGDADGLSPSVISRLKNKWYSEYEAWSRRDLSHKRYVYFWADGVYFNVRMENDRHCMLVIIGATEDGQKEILAIADGYRESTESWQEMLRDIKMRGLKIGPLSATGDGALGFWKGLTLEYPDTRHQRCWVHKTVNILDKLPKSEQGRGKAMIHDIWMAPTKALAEKNFDSFIRIYETKYPKAVKCLKDDRAALLAFYDFPAEHWVHLRTSNPIESMFSSVRLRTDKTRGCLSRNNMLAMVFKLAMSAQKRWRHLKGAEKIQDLIRGFIFIDGEREAA